MRLCLQTVGSQLHWFLTIILAKVAPHELNFINVCANGGANRFILAFRKSTAKYFFLEKSHNLCALIVVTGNRWRICLFLRQY